jgi:carboxyl-terminal processing protease
VRDGGGVTPDIKIEDEKTPNIIYYLINDFIVFDFATQYASKHTTIPSVSDFAINDEEYKSFREFVKSRNFVYDRQSEKALKELEDVTKFEGYYESAEPEFKALKAKLTHDLDKSLTIFSNDIRDLLEAEIIKRYYYQKGEIAHSLMNDKDIKKATGIVSDAKVYSEILNPIVKTK